MSRNLLMLAVFIAISLSSSIGRAGGAATLGVSVPAGQQLSFDQINHAPWDALLRKYCDAQGFVNYQAWQRSNQDQQALDNYLSQLSRAAANRPAAPAAKLAFWINAYNAVTIKGILREYPTTSIRNHTAKVFGYNIWDDLLLQVGNRTYSLNQMEHEVLRKMGEPRVHFAIVCASIGCPPLLNQAYTAGNLENQLRSIQNVSLPIQENFALEPISAVSKCRPFCSGLPETLVRTKLPSCGPLLLIFLTEGPRRWPRAARRP